jgi:hypothetical protein
LILDPEMGLGMRELREKEKRLKNHKIFVTVNKNLL